MLATSPATSSLSSFWSAGLLTTGSHRFFEQTAKVLRKARICSPVWLPSTSSWICTQARPAGRMASPSAAFRLCGGLLTLWQETCLRCRHVLCGLLQSTASWSRSGHMASHLCSGPRAGSQHGSLHLVWRRVSASRWILCLANDTLPIWRRPKTWLARLSLMPKPRTASHRQGVSCSGTSSCGFSSWRCCADLESR